jgi:hypothetical protein
MSGPSATGRERGDRNGSGVEFPLAAGFRLDKARDQHIPWDLAVAYMPANESCLSQFSGTQLIRDVSSG